MENERKCYGHPLIGVWFCEKCDTSLFPNPVRELENQGLMTWAGGWFCPSCGNQMIYEEEGG